MVADDPTAPRDDFGPVLGDLPLVKRLTEPQRRAALERERDVLVTAGAGTGKTLTLVARYLSLLDRGVHPRRILAITFTEKAALEMRSRVRSAVTDAADRASTADEREAWLALEATMDSARIGTIHSFCAEVLRNHLAEAVLDPSFEVIDEGTAAQLKADAVEDALGWLAGTAGDEAGLFELFSPEALSRLLGDLLKRRLDADEVLVADAARRPVHAAAAARWSALVSGAAQAFAADPAVQEAIEELRALARSGSLADDAGPKLADQVAGLLGDWSDVEAAVREGRGVDACIGLFRLRRTGLGLGRGKTGSEAKEAVRALQTAYDEHATPWLGGKSTGDAAPSHAVEEAFDRCTPWLASLYGRAAGAYRAALDARRAVDFDTLEGVAVDLLEREQVRRRWRDAFDAVLVDEFQDTNTRQVRIVRALTHERKGSLFVVGDARQSIYRFRGADVTAFRGLAAEMRSSQALPLELDTSYRSHDGLLAAFDAILPPIMGSDDDPERRYLVPYTSLRSDRDVPRSRVRAPYVEVVLGQGENADEARRSAARALADRLVRMRSEGEIAAWDAVGMLFRASTGFAIYETALETAGIPFVTVAGRGFYDRPEVRDVLGMLRALAQPWDDAAMAGVLRSPAFGLSDASLFLLRGGVHDTRPLRAALDGDLAVLDSDERARAIRAASVLRDLEPFVDRLAVAELLKKLVDATDYRAVLASSGRDRPWRNLDKLLADAHASRLVRVRAFLDYLTTLKDVGAREGEAPAEAYGAVQLMTVHKAKGLEFPIVVLADASHAGGGKAPACYLVPGQGLAVQPDKLDGRPLVFGIARWRDGAETDAESRRLLYVAMTRAEDKVLVSGGAVDRGSGTKVAGWVGDLLTSAGIDLDEVTASPDGTLDHMLSDTARFRVVVAAATESPTVDPDSRGAATAETAWPHSDRAALWNPLPAQPGPPRDARETAMHVEELHEEEPERGWRATKAGAAPPKVVGRLVHRAIERWCFPGDPGYDGLMEAEAIGERLVDGGQRARATARASKLLSRLRRHPLWSEIDGADERHHELPFVAPGRDGRENAGYIDLLYRNALGWHVIDFKTDAIEGEDVLAGPRAQYSAQVGWYVATVRQLTGAPASARLCFLDCDGDVMLVTVLRETDEAGPPTAGT